MTNALCPIAGKPGKPVPLVTLKSLVLPEHACAAHANPGGPSFEERVAAQRAIEYEQRVSSPSVRDTQVDTCSPLHGIQASHASAGQNVTAAYCR